MKYRSREEQGAQGLYNSCRESVSPLSRMRSEVFIISTIDPPFGRANASGIEGLR